MFKHKHKGILTMLLTSYDLREGGGEIFHIWPEIISLRNYCLRLNADVSTRTNLVPEVLLCFSVFPWVQYQIFQVSCGFKF